MYMNKFVPVYTLLILIYSFNASAEWTGDNTNAYYSDEVISELHVGQIDTSPYFCIKTVKANGSGTPVVACAVSKQSIWAPSFKEWICPYISRHLLSLNPLLARCRRYSR
ncbi:subtilase family AB5 toxin binding subunit, partial [Salmonella enterica]|nr:subtilase family AB5 toxin binding subunit [Salmonella enterica]